MRDESSSASTGLDEVAKGKNPVAITGDSCFVIMPFSEPINVLYKEVYKPAIEAAGLAPVRADNDIFTTGKIIEQIWREINESRILIAELTSKNANVFYELGLAHALNKPVILVSRNRDDVPFDVHHVRVIFYDVNDPAWGSKLISKIKDTIIELIENPSDAILFSNRHS